MISTLRHIFTEDAAPTTGEKNVAASPSAVATGSNAAACGPPRSMGVRKPVGGTDAITAAST